MSTGRSKPRQQRNQVERRGIDLFSDAPVAADVLAETGGHHCIGFGTQNRQASRHQALIKNAQVNRWRVTSTGEPAEE